MEGGIGACPNVGGICIGCTMPAFPDRDSEKDAVAEL